MITTKQERGSALREVLDYLEREYSRYSIQDNRDAATIAAHIKKQIKHIETMI